MMANAKIYFSLALFLSLLNFNEGKFNKDLTDPVLGTGFLTENFFNIAQVLTRPTKSSSSCCIATLTCS